jgi:hypothetical protein
MLLENRNNELEKENKILKDDNTWLKENFSCQNHIKEMFEVYEKIYSNKLNEYVYKFES